MNGVYQKKSKNHSTRTLLQKLFLVIFFKIKITIQSMVDLLQFSLLIVTSQTVCIILSVKI